MDGGDPRVSKSRLPKPYTEEQLVFLRSHTSGFEVRTRGHVRGDAKKFALDRATEFLVRFGLPPDLQGVEEAEPRFREQIYNWYKNTVGRARRKLEGRTRPKKSSFRASTLSAPAITWSPSLATTGPISYVPPTDSSDQPSTSTQALQSQSQSQSQSPPQANPGPSTQPQPQLQFTFQSSLPVPSASTIALNVTPSALRDAFITHAIDAPTLSSLIQSYVLAHPSAAPLVPVISSLFDAATQLLGRSAAGGVGVGTGAHGHDREQLFALLRRFVDACAFFPPSLVHADMNGPLAGPRALQIALRKASVWAPVSSPFSSSLSSSASMAAGTGAGHGSLSDEMERIAADRQRRKEYVQWAQIHAAAIELGILPSSVPSPLSSPTTSNPGVLGVGVGAGAGVGVGGVGVGGVGVGVGVGGSTYHHPHPSSDMSAYGVPPPQPQSQSPHSHAHSHPHSHPHTLAHAHSHTHHPHAHPHPTTSTPTPTATLPLSFSEAMARDAVWEPDEVEWVAGIIVLRAIIRTFHPSRAGVCGGRHLKAEYEQLLGAYERRWKEIKDEARQAIVTEVLLGARDDLARMDDTRVT